jgi:hypothetical protein
MKPRKVKSLGALHWPTAELERFDGQTGRVEILLKAGPRTLPLEFNGFCGAKTLTDLARKIVARQREHALHEWHTYETLRDYTGYKAPDGDK